MYANAMIYARRKNTIWLCAIRQSSHCVASVLQLAELSAAVNMLSTPEHWKFRKIFAFAYVKWHLLLLMLSPLKFTKYMVAREGARVQKHFNRIAISSGFSLSLFFASHWFFASLNNKQYTADSTYYVDTYCIFRFGLVTDVLPSFVAFIALAIGVTMCGGSWECYWTFVDMEDEKKTQKTTPKILLRLRRYV